MKKNISIPQAFVALAISIVLPVYSSVKLLSSNRTAAVSVALLSGSPLPAPPPPGSSFFAASGSPLPAPPPPGFSVSVAAVSGSPLPAPPPPGRLA
jgi:hypothetical protein